MSERSSTAWGGWFLACVAGVLLLLRSGPAAVGAPAVTPVEGVHARSDAQDARIRAHRQSELIFIVLDREDRGAQGAVVRIEQETHAFRIGFRLPADGPPMPAGYDPDAAGWRVFNAVSLAERTGWRDLQPDGPGDFEGRRIRAALTEAARAGLAARWGPLVPGSVIDLPEWAVPLRGDDLRRVLAAYLDRVVGRYGHAVTGIDLPGRPADGRLGFGMVRLLQQQADALAPGTPLNLAFAAGLAGPEAGPARQRAESAAQQFVGHRGLTLGGRLGAAASEVLDPALERWRALARPAVIEPLAVAEDPTLASGENLRRVLRSLFAEPWIDGIYFNAITPASAGRPRRRVVRRRGRAHRGGGRAGRIVCRNVVDAGRSHRRPPRAGGGPGFLRSPPRVGHPARRHRLHHRAVDRTGRRSAAQGGAAAGVRGGGDRSVGRGGNDDALIRRARFAARLPGPSPARSPVQLPEDVGQNPVVVDGLQMRELQRPGRHPIRVAAGRGGVAVAHDPVAAAHVGQQRVPRRRQGRVQALPAAASRVAWTGRAS